MEGSELSGNFCLGVRRLGTSDFSLHSHNVSYGQLRQGFCKAQHGPTISTDPSTASDRRTWAESLGHATTFDARISGVGSRKTLIRAVAVENCPLLWLAKFRDLSRTDMAEHQSGLSLSYDGIHMIGFRNFVVMVRGSRLGTSLQHPVLIAREGTVGFRILFIIMPHQLFNWGARIYYYGR